MLASLLIAASLSPPPPVILSRTLDNGVRVVAERLPGSTRFSAQVLVRAGSVYETPETNGLNHLLEHMLFRGSSGLASGEADRRAEAAGATLNATTYREVVRFVCDGPNEAWKTGLDVVSLLVAEPALKPEHVRVEKGVVEEEIAYLRSDPARLLNRSLWSRALTGDPLALPTEGEPSALHGLSSQALLDLYRRHYGGENMVVAVVGDFDPSAALELAAERLGSLPRGEAGSPRRFPKFRPGRRAEDSPFRESYAAFAFPAPGLGRPADYAAWEVLAQVLAGQYGRASAAGLEADSFYGPTEAGSLFTVIFSGTPEAEGLEAASLRLLRSLAEAGVTSQEAEDAKRRVAALYGARRRDASHRAFLLSLYTLFATTDDLKSIEARIAGVTLEEVNVAARTMSPENAMVVVWRAR
ncbi:MAG: insulinase family protein [Armatimonadetes bacterium]|nr:insulinase family protein [Armatimonadota bacterium]